MDGVEIWARDVDKWWCKFREVLASLVDCGSFAAGHKTLFFKDEVLYIGVGACIRVK